MESTGNSLLESGPCASAASAKNGSEQRGIFWLTTVQETRRLTSGGALIGNKQPGLVSNLLGLDHLGLWALAGGALVLDICTPSTHHKPGTHAEVYCIWQQDTCTPTSCLYCKCSCSVVVRDNPELELQL